jgi:hypothetical protein
MSLAHIRTATVLASLAIASTGTSASATWQWVDDDPPRETHVETHVYEEPRGPNYYQQEAPQTYYEERRVEVPVAPVVTNTEVFRDGPCEVTRTYLSDGTSSDDRVCSEYHIVPPHVFIIDRIGRHFDRLRGYHY